MMHLGGLALADRTVKPSRYRLQHGRVERVPDTVQDVHGMIGDPWRGLTLLDEWERSGRITREMRLAGDKFHELFHLACLDPLAAADMGRVGGARGPLKHRGSVRARDELHAALEALGGLESMLGSCAWSVLGEEHSIRHWAGIYGRATLSERAATGCVMGVLGALKVHMGY